ncbi:MAG: SurA N-terminal domain-containing protein [Holosporaceae bacterium]|jgi:hypothetical protein|nr:SurA N-terminal domain-containing protein [Holosporaceae bacterium]
MLELIRRHSQSIIVKAFLTILALTFVLFFGISDVIRRITGKDYVVKIGSIKISPLELKIEKARRAAMLKMQGKDIEDKNLTYVILHQLIWESIIDQAAQDYGIVVSEEAIKNYINGMNVFRNKDGSFNANLLRRFLQRIQLPEAMFVETVKKDIKNMLIRFPFAYVDMSAELDLFMHANLEKRSLAIVELKPSSFKITEKPTKEALEEFYKNNPDLFMAEETRSFRILELKEASVEKDVQISEEEIKEAYDNSPEKEDRTYDDMKAELETTLKQESIQSRVNEVTRQIEDALMVGEEIDAVVKKFNLNVIAIEDVDSKNKSAKSNAVISLPYKGDILAVAFSLDEGTDSSFSEVQEKQKEKVYWLLHLDKITPKHLIPLEECSGQVLQEWEIHWQKKKAEETASNYIQQLKNGGSLEKIASKDKREYRVSPYFDRLGHIKDEKNKKFQSIIDVVHENAFTLEKTEADYKEIEGAFVVYQVNDVLSATKIDPEDERKYKDLLRDEIMDDMSQQLVGYLSKRFEIKINQEALKQFTSETNQSSPDEMF